MAISRFFLLLVTFALSGCETIDVLTFNRDTRSGTVGEAVTSLSIIDAATDLNSQSTLSQISGFPGLQDSLSRCRPVSQSTAARAPAFVVPLAGLAVDAGVRAFSEAIQARVDALKEASVRSYSGVLILDDARSFGIGTAGSVAQCFLLLRHIGGAEGLQPASALLLGVIPRGITSKSSAAAAVFSPLYVHIERSAAVTRAGRPINMAVAVSVVAIVAPKTVPERKDISLGSFQISNVELGRTRTWTNKANAGTGLMMLPPPNANALEFRMAVVETGSALPDFDKAKAEVQAVRDVVGPELKAGLLKALPRE